MNKDLNFSQPQEIIDYLTSTKVDYSLLLETANELCQKIEIPHTNLEGQKFHTISQCILEAFKRICGFSSTKWISEKNLTRPLKDGQNFITFTRINAKKDICIYKIANFDQIDFENEFADEIECEKETLPAAEKTVLFRFTQFLKMPRDILKHSRTMTKNLKKLSTS